VDAYDASVLADELVELIRITNGDVLLAESLGQQRFDDTQALRDILCLPIRPGFCLVCSVDIEHGGIAGREGREQHLFPGAVHVLGGFRGTRRKNNLSSTRGRKVRLQAKPWMLTRGSLVPSKTRMSLRCGQVFSQSFHGERPGAQPRASFTRTALDVREHETPSIGLTLNVRCRRVHRVYPTALLRAPVDCLSSD
jgi:hypothetical protein